MVYLANKTLIKINQMLEADQGNLYRSFLQKVMPHVGDAYRQSTSEYRSHMGASGIGKQCARAIFYSFRWAANKKHPGRMVRLFNRGHMEEARIIALLLMIGMQVYQQDAQGRQFAIKRGHFGGSGDGVGVGCPDLLPGTPALLEFKTANEKAFVDMVKLGVILSKFVHYVQMQCYMKGMGLTCALYVMVCKNNDEMYMELIAYDPVIADQYYDRAYKIERCITPPPKLHNSPGHQDCRWCDYQSVCHLRAEPPRTCRSCKHVVADEGGTWSCIKYCAALSFDQQVIGCSGYERGF